MKFAHGQRVKIQYGKSRHLIWQKMFLGKVGIIEQVATGTLPYKVSCCAHWLNEDELCLENEEVNTELPPMAIVNPTSTTYVSTPRTPSFQNIDQLFKVTRAQT